MTARVMTFAAVALATALVSTTAGAADLPPPQPYEPPVVYHEDPASGWYLRGDVGLSIANEAKGEWDFWNQVVGAQGIDDTYRYDSLKLREGAVVGLGVGYQFSDTFRTDFTVDYFTADVDGRTKCPYMIMTDPAHGLHDPNSTCYYDHASSASVWSAMANAYVDLPVESVLRPYIGAGAGVAYVKYDDFAEQEVCPNCPPAYTPYSTTKEGVGSARFAAAVMAGVTYDLSKSLKLDAGYRFMHITGGDMYKYDAADTAANASGVQARDHGFNLHQVRAGLRYQFN